MDVRFRIVADHVRSALMIMSDGVRPSNNGRGYVLRRLLRRTVKAMRELGVTGPVMPTLLPTSKAAMEPSYPELNNTFHDVSEAAYGEEDAFRRTLESGTEIFDLAVAKAKESGSPSTCCHFKVAIWQRCFLAMEYRVSVSESSCFLLSAICTMVRMPNIIR